MDEAGRPLSEEEALRWAVRASLSEARRQLGPAPSEPPPAPPEDPAGRLRGTDGGLSRWGRGGLYLFFSFFLLLLFLKVLLFVSLASAKTKL